MEPTSMMRVNAHSSSYGGHGSTPQDRQHQRRQKKLALIDAVEHGHLEASKHALKVLMKNHVHQGCQAAQQEDSQH